MGTKLIFTGLTLIEAVAIIHIPDAAIVGAIFMVLGTILLWLDK